MNFKNKGAELFIPDNMPVDMAINRTTHMGISAHQDDLEIMAYDGILQCFGNSNNWFFGIVTTNGSGSPRDGLYKDYSDEDMQRIRKHEQKKAAYTGEYGAVAMLNYPSSSVKDPDNKDVADELKELILAAAPKVIYTHNLADKHDTHVGTTIKTIRALRDIPEDRRPEKIFGCEVWRGLDWMNDDDKVAFDVASHPNIAAALVEIFDSQICGGKRYDLATVGRRLANATYMASHGTDDASSLIYAMDLTPLIADTEADIGKYIEKYIMKFNQDVSDRILKLL